MKINLGAFKEALNTIGAAVRNDKFTIMAEDGILRIYGEQADGFIIVQELGETDETFNLMVSYSRLKATIAFFEGEYLYIEKLPQTLLFHTDGDNYFRTEVVYSELGETLCKDKLMEKASDKVEVKFLSQYVNKTAHALEKMRFMQTGADIRKDSFFLETDGANIKMTVTDGHRVSVRSGKMGKVKYGFVLPGTYLKAASARIGNMVVLEVLKNAIRICDKGMTIIIPVVADSFYNLDQVIKASFDGGEEFVIDRQAFLNACKMVSVATNKTMLQTMKGEVDTLVVSGTDKLMDNKREIMLVENTCPDKSIIASTQFMADALESFSCTQVKCVLTKSMCNITAVEKKKKEGAAIELVLLCKA